MSGAGVELGGHFNMAENVLGSFKANVSFKLLAMDLKGFIVSLGLNSYI